MPTRTTPSRTRHAVRRRQDEALRLRQMGLTYDEIGRRIGLVRADGRGQTGTVSRAIAAAQARVDLAARYGVTAQTISTTTVTPLVGARKFGVEIEFNGITRRAAVDALRAAGINVEQQSYNHRVQSIWKLIYDSSVRNTGTGEVSGHELVSPPLSGPEGVAELTRAMNALVAAGAKVDLSCGLHVHHDVNDLTGDEIARVVEFYATRQDAIDALVARSRRRGGRGSRWCGRLDSTDVARIGESFRNTRTAPVSISRYKTINVASFPKYGTIEIRQHQGTLNAKKLTAWIALGQAMIQSVKDATDTTISTDLASMINDLTTHGLDAGHARTLLRRAASLV